MRTKDLKVIQKVAENISEYDWSFLSPGQKNYKAIEFPIDAEEHINDFYAEVFKGLTVVVGAYRSRFYYEEDEYSWEKKCYAAIISTSEGGANGISFITNEDFETINKKSNLFFSNTMNIGLGLNRQLQKNAIINLYDSVNRKVSGIEDLYNEFLEEDE